MSNYKQEVFDDDLGWGIFHLRDPQKLSNPPTKVFMW